MLSTSRVGLRTSFPSNSSSLYRGLNVLTTRTNFVEDEGNKGHRQESSPEQVRRCSVGNGRNHSLVPCALPHQIPSTHASSILFARGAGWIRILERLMREGVLRGAYDDWQPPTSNDTRVRKGCWKDKWFVQLSAVLDNWEEYSKLSYVGFVPHLLQFRNSLTGYPNRFAGNLNQDNHDNLQRLLFCLPHYSLPISPDAPAECQHQNTLTVVLSAHWWVDMARGHGEPSGEYCIEIELYLRY